MRWPALSRRAPRGTAAGLISSLMGGVLAMSGCTSAVLPVEPTATDQPRLILVQVLDRSEYAVGNALMSGAEIPGDTNRVPSASSIAYVPASVLVPVVGASPQRDITLGFTPILPDTLAPKTSTEAAFDLSLDGSWTLDLLAFAGLIDAVGGVIIDIPQTVRLVDVESESVVVLPTGRQRLGGITAADYVTASLGSDFPVDQLQRFRDVWIAVLARLPDSPERLRQILTSLGFLARTTASVETLLEVLESGRASVLDQTVDEQFISVDVIRGGARPAAVVTSSGSRTVATMFAEFSAPGSIDTRISSQGMM